MLVRSPVAQTVSPSVVASVRRLVRHFVRCRSATKVFHSSVHSSKRRKAVVRQLRSSVNRKSGRFVELHADDASSVPLSEASASKLIDIAELSAVIAIARTSSSRKRGSVLLSSNAALIAQRHLKRGIKSMSRERMLAAPLARSLGSLCWHLAWGAAWKTRLAEKSGSFARHNKKLSAELEFQVRLDDLRAEFAADHAQEKLSNIPKQTGWRGVNLGGWLLWEYGPCNTAPVVQAVGNVPMDEWSLSLQLRQKYGDEEATRLMRQHRLSFITKTDFAQIAELGLNSVRIPFSYWMFEGPRSGEPFLGPDVDILDNAFQWALEFGLKVVLSFHGTVGFHSDHQACGKFDDNWSPSSWDPKASLDVLSRVAARYKDNAALGGITVVNEPSSEIPIDVLRQYYKDGYRVIRQAGVPENVEVIFPLYHRQVEELSGHFPESQGYRNVVFDLHIYHCFGDHWAEMSLAEHLRYAAGDDPAHEVQCLWEAGERVIVSEFSLALPTSSWDYMLAWEWSYLSRAEKNAVLRSFAIRQMKTFAAYATSGWFFWSWKDEAGSDWSLRDAVAKRLVPLGKTPSLKLQPTRPFSLARPASAAKWYRRWQED